MKKTLLKFSSSMYLIAFRKFSKAKYWEIDLSELTVYCDCSEKEALHACRDFKAIQLTPGEIVELTPGKLAEMNVSQLTYRVSSK